MRDYLYIDEDRVITYHEQCSSPVTYDKVPMWKVSLGFPSVGVKTQQSRVARQRTLHEKIEEVIKHIRSNGLLREGGSDGDFQAVFGHEILNARKLRFRKSEPPLCLWYADERMPSEKRIPGKVFLIEDYRSDDDKYPDRFSGYSSLMLLYHALDNIPEGHRLIAEHHPISAREAFARNPLETFNSLGDETGQPQRIEVVYRLRATCMAEEDNYHSVTTIAYPLAIWAA